MCRPRIAQHHVLHSTDGAGDRGVSDGAQHHVLLGALRWRRRRASRTAGPSSGRIRTRSGTPTARAHLGHRRRLPERTRSSAASARRTSYRTSRGRWPTPGTWSNDGQSWWWCTACVGEPAFMTVLCGPTFMVETAVDETAFRVEKVLGRRRPWTGRPSWSRRPWASWASRS